MRTAPKSVFVPDLEVSDVRKPSDSNAARQRVLELLESRQGWGVFTLIKVCPKKPYGRPYNMALILAAFIDAEIASGIPGTLADAQTCAILRLSSEVLAKYKARLIESGFIVREPGSESGCRVNWELLASLLLDGAQ